MSRGVGRTQQAILDALPRQAGEGRTTSVLAEELHRSPRQVRTAVQALAERGLVAVSKQVIWWKTENIPVYGLLVMHIESYADWLEKMQQIRDRAVCETNHWVANMAQLGLLWKFLRPGTNEAREAQRDYARAVEDRLNRWITDAVDCCRCRTCTCPCHDSATAPA
jgi:predicted transcriptional regulator